MRSGNALRMAAAAVLLLSLGGCSNMRFWEHKNRHEGYRTTAVDLNTANHRELSQLPSLNDQDADRIIKNRPYTRKRDLVDRNIIGPKKFDEIRDYVYVGGPRSSERGTR